MIKMIEKTKNSKIKQNKSKIKNWKVIVIALYITFLLLSAIPFIADKTMQPLMKESYEHHLVYRTDGRVSHYYVERVNKNEIGQIDLIYTEKSNTLIVSTTNIDMLRIYCRSMYEEECKKVFGFDPSENYNYYKWYFIEKNHLTVYIKSDHKIKELSFIDTPIPYEVIVNGYTWYEGKQYNYTDGYKTVLSNVPKGNTHVDIYFKTNDKNRPHANIDADKTLVCINTLINFDAQGSYDNDGKIESYIWDFGDGNNSGGVVNYHSYTEPGIYTVILTVRDDDFLVDQAFLNITVMKGSSVPSINGIVPNQIKDEDSPPWELDLQLYGMDIDGYNSDLRWYILGENNSLYQVIGKNASDQKIIFSLIPNANGNDLVDLVLVDNDGYNTTQQLWINITPINDRPFINSLPKLVVHYDVPYRFSLENYISDVETPKYELKISVQDDYDNQYISIVDQDIIFEYPKKLINKVILVTITVSDGEDSSIAMMSVSVSDNWPPILMDKLPDVVLKEGEAKYNAFDLDDYFSDPDEDELFFKFSPSNVQIIIKANNSVDFISRGHWNGEEYIIFRAIDSYDGFVEDLVKITVIPINDPPNIGDVPDLRVHYDLDYYFDLSYYIHDNDSKLSELTLETDDPDHIRLSPKNNLGLILNYPKSLLGITIPVKLTVSDQNFKVSKWINVTVMKEFPPELKIKLPDITFNEDESLEEIYNLDEYFMDLDNDSLYYTSGNKRVHVTIDPDHNVSFSATSNWFGMERVVFRAEDRTDAIVEDSIMVTVVPVNDPPELLPLPALKINESDTIVFDLAPFIYDIDNDISELYVLIDEENIFVSGTKLIIMGSKSLPSELQVGLSDGKYTVMGSLKLKIISKKVQENDLLSELILYFILITITIITIILLIIRSLYKKMQEFDIEEIFLIHNSGKLLNHIYLKKHSKFDDEIFSGMFTAIQEFIEDTFTGGEDLNPVESKSAESKKPMKLNEFKVGDQQVIIEHGKYIFMAVVYTGPGAVVLHRVIKHSINNIETKFGDELEWWDGDIKKIAGIKMYLEQLLSSGRINKMISKRPKKISVKKSRKITNKVSIEELRSKIT